MKIGINGYETVVARFGYNPKTGLPNRAGSSEYVFELLKGIYKFSKNDFFIYLPGPPTPDLPKENDNWHYVVIPKKSLWTIFSLSKEFLFNKVKLDVFFSATHYLPAFCPYPSIVSVMDLSYLHFPQLFKVKDLWQLRLWTKFSVGKAKKVITISCASKNDIIKEYGIEASRIAVTYPGIKIKNQKSKGKMTSQNLKVLKKYGVSSPYILFVGTIQPRKNIVKLIEAFTMILGYKDTRILGANGEKARNIAISQYPNLNLIVIGRPGWMYEDIFAAPKKFGVENRVKFLTEVTSEELPVFYKNAACFILPSLYEGFGLPILEAMQYGCPVITSNVSSLPEAGGEAALYVNPENVEDIKEKIEMVISDEKLRNEMIKKGLAQVKKFSWEKTARETLKVLEEVAYERQNG